MSFSSFLLRYMFKKGDDKRDFGLMTPPSVKRFDDIVYGEDPLNQVLDVYRPKDVEGKLPVIVSVHGGGWVYGDKERYQYYCMSLVEHGFAVINYTYRLAPKFKFPSQLEDAVLVFNWLIDHSEEYGFDVNNVFGVGDSAGAHLLSLYSCLCTNEDYASNFVFKVKNGFVPKAVALNCGLYEVNINNKKDFVTHLVKDLLKNKGTIEEVNLINVLQHINSSFPSSFVMTAINDIAKPQAPLIVEKLKENNIKHVYKVYGDESNPLGHVFHCNVKTYSAHDCNKEECDFFKSFI